MGALRPNARTKANRLNAKASTGPRTDSGKKKSSKNAMTHGLSTPWVGRDWHQSLDKLAVGIAGSDANPAELNIARDIARCELDLMHAWNLRARLWRYVFREPNDDELLKTPFSGCGNMPEYLEPVLFQDPLGIFPKWKKVQIERRRREYFIELKETRDPLSQLKLLDRYETTIRIQRANAAAQLDRLKANSTP